MQAPDLVDLARHASWADALVWTAVLGYPEAARDGKIHAWLYHAHSVQRVYATLWRGEEPRIPEENGLAGALVLARWGYGANRAVLSYLRTASESDLERILELPWAKRLEEKYGPIAPVTVAETALQVAMHSTHHRGQLAARLRELGGEAPTVDFISWLWRGKPEAEWPEEVLAG
ncbi:MAG TPA: DinB family protein [Thermoanaerobaculia bacterium]|nr:DinB family protein [Thermoanaerobaculia bacterium]